MHHDDSKKILFISPFSSPNIGGVETHIDLLTQSLAGTEFEGTLLTYQPLTSENRAKSVEKHGSLTIYRYAWFGKDLFTKLQRYPLLFNFLYLTPYLLIRSFMYMLLNRNNVDVIHVFGLNAALIGRVLKFFFHKPVVLTTKGVYGFYGYTTLGKVTRNILSGMDYILIGSLDAKDDMLNLGIQEKKLVLFDYWIDQSIFKPGTKKKSSAFTIIYAGRLIPEKGIHIILKAAKKLPDVQFTITGEGSLHAMVKEETRRLKNVTYFQKTSSKELATYLNSSDIFLFPVTYREDVSLAVLESLACGIPVISSFRGSGKYRLTEKEAIICQSSSSEVLDTIVFAKNNPKQLAEMKKAALQFSKKFTKSSSEKILNTYQLALQSKI